MKKKITLLFVIMLLLTVITACTSNVTVKFDSNGGSACASLNVPMGSTITLPKDPVREGYIFKGWYLGENKFDPSTAVNENIVLIAKWEDDANIFSITYNIGEGATLPSDVPTMFDRDKAQEVKLPTPVKPGYDFIGWYEGTTRVDTLTENKDYNLTAQFEKTGKIIPYAVNLPANIQMYNMNKGDKDNDGNSKGDTNEFMVWNESYLVGDDNNWSFKPNVTFYKFGLNLDGSLNTNEFEEVLVAAWKYEIVIYQYNNATSKYDILVDNNDATIIDAIDYENCTIDFADSATSEERAYLVKVTPTGLTENQSNNKDKYTISINVEVVDGYNVYKVEELALMDNRTDTAGKEWDKIKEAAGIDINLNPTRLVLHSNFELKDENLPVSFFYQENEVNKTDKDYSREYNILNTDGTIKETITVKVVGSLKDYVNVYYRDMAQNETFSIEGNYFQIDTSKISLVIRENNEIKDLGTVITHSSLFKFIGDGTSNVVMQNLNLLGNANRSENALKGGGLILNKLENVQATMKNNITSCYFISYMFKLTSVLQTAVNCKAYDSFNCFVYSWGASNVEIRDSEFIGAGGPAIIQDHVNATDADGGYVPGVKLIDSNIQSYVAGSEGWFVLVGATGVVPQIKAMDLLFNPFGKSFLKINKNNNIKYFNLVSVVKSGSATTITAEKVKGSLVIKKADSETTFNYGLNNPYLAGLLEMTFVQGAPAFESSAGGFGYTDGATGIFDIQNQQIVDPTNPIYSGEYLTLYYQGMMLTFEYGIAGQEYTA